LGKKPRQMTKSENFSKSFWHGFPPVAYNKPDATRLDFTKPPGSDFSGRFAYG
jgi:hypothetical protein